MLHSNKLINKYEEENNYRGYSRQKMPTTKKTKVNTILSKINIFLRRLNNQFYCQLKEILNKTIVI